MKKNKQDLVSVIIPYYKKRLYFKKTFLSAYNQTYKYKELIIIYDDSSKLDLEFIKQIIKKKKRIKLIVNKNNLGAGESRNIGIKRSKGKFIAFLDSDDSWHKDKLKIQINFIKKNNYMATFTSYKIINIKNKNSTRRRAKKIIKYNDLIKSCDIGLSTVLIHRNALNNGLRFPKIKTKEDFILWLKISKKFNFYGLDKTLTYWLKTDKSLSSSIIQKIIDGFRVYYVHMKFNIFKSIFYLLILIFNYLKKVIF